MDISNVQLIDRKTGMCLGTKDLNTNTPGLVTCNDNDQTQRWDLNGIYHRYGYLEKPYLTGSNTEYAATPGKRIILPSKSAGNYNTTVDSAPLSYDLSDPLAGYYKKNGQFQYDGYGNIKGVFAPSRTSATDTYYQPCLNVNLDKSVGHMYGKARLYDTDDTSGNCDTQWDILYNCDPTTMGTMVAANVQCDRKKGKYVCKPGYYGKNCDFADSAAKSQQDAYDRMFTNCVAGVTTGMSNPDNCKKYHSTQTWLPSSTDTNWFNANFSMWNLNNNDDSNFNQREIDNRTKISALDTQNDTAYFAKKKVYDDLVFAINADKETKSAQQKTRIADKTKIYNDNVTNLASLKSQNLTYTVPLDHPEVVAANKAVAVSRGLLTSGNNSLTIQQTSLNSKIATLMQQDQDNQVELAKLRAELGL